MLVNAIANLKNTTRTPAQLAPASLYLGVLRAGGTFRWLICFSIDGFSGYRSRIVFGGGGWTISTSSTRDDRNTGGVVIFLRLANMGTQVTNLTQPYFDTVNNFAAAINSGAISFPTAELLVASLLDELRRSFGLVGAPGQTMVDQAVGIAKPRSDANQFLMPPAPMYDANPLVTF